MAKADRRKGIGHGDSSLEGQVAGDDAFEVAVFGAEEQGAVVAEGFGAAADLAVAGADGDLMAEGGAMGFPLVGDGGEGAGGDAGVIMVQFAQDGDGEFGAGDGFARTRL